MPAISGGCAEGVRRGLLLDRRSARSAFGHGYRAMLSELLHVPHGRWRSRL